MPGQVELLLREERYERLERHAVAYLLGVSAVNLQHFHQREILLEFARRTNGATHRVAGFQASTPYLLLRHIDVVGRCQIIVVRRAEETESLGLHLQHTLGLYEALLLKWEFWSADVRLAILLFIVVVFVLVLPAVTTVIVLPLLLAVLLPESVLVVILLSCIGFLLRHLLNLLSLLFYVDSFYIGGLDLLLLFLLLVFFLAAAFLSLLHWLYCLLGGLRSFLLCNLGNGLFCIHGNLDGLLLFHFNHFLLAATALLHRCLWLGNRCLRLSLCHGFFLCGILLLTLACHLLAATLQVVARTGNIRHRRDNGYLQVFNIQFKRRFFHLTHTLSGHQQGFLFLALLLLLLGYHYESLLFVSLEILDVRLGDRHRFQTRPALMLGCLLFLFSRCCRLLCLRIENLVNKLFGIQSGSPRHPQLLGYVNELDMSL